MSSVKVSENLAGVQLPNEKLSLEQMRECMEFSCCPRDLLHDQSVANTKYNMDRILISC